MIINYLLFIVSIYPGSIMLLFSAPVTTRYHRAKIGFLTNIGRILLLIFTTFCIFLLATIYTFIYDFIYFIYFQFWITTYLYILYIFFIDSVYFRLRLTGLRNSTHLEEIKKRAEVGERA